MNDKTVHLKQNELPSSPHQAITKAAATALEQAHRYSSWDSLELREVLAEQFGVEPDWVVAASGSVNVIQQAMLVAGPGEIAFCWPSFDAFPPLAKARGMRVKLAKVKPDGSCDLADLRSRVTSKTKMVIICTPNTPTGGIVSHQAVVDFLAEVPPEVLVLIDEAYGEFVDESEAVRGVELVRAYPNVIMTRTFSKAYGLAGMRVGYGIAQPELAKIIMGAGVPYALTRPAEKAAIEAIRQHSHMEANVAKVVVERAHLTRELRQRGVEVVEGHGNFIWLPRQGDEERLVEQLAVRGILVKAYPGYGVRISIGTRADTKQLLAAWLTTTKQQKKGE